MVSGEAPARSARASPKKRDQGDMLPSTPDAVVIQLQEMRMPVTELDYVSVSGRAAEQFFQGGDHSGRLTRRLTARPD